jgi:hypothetical protein
MNFATLGKILRIVGDYYMGIKGVSTLLTVTVSIVQAGFLLFVHATVKP